MKMDRVESGFRSWEGLQHPVMRKRVWKQQRQRRYFVSLYGDSDW